MDHEGRIEPVLLERRRRAVQHLFPLDLAKRPGRLNDHFVDVRSFYLASGRRRHIEEVGCEYARTYQSCA